MIESLKTKKSHIFVGIGEVLFDIFEDGTETLGGAPLNFSVHIHQLASHLGVGQGIIVSSVNSDARGHKIIKSLKKRKMSLQYIGKDENHPTGRVSVFMKNGEPGYQIESEAAWDYIYDKPGLKELAGQCSAVYFGSLAQRCSVSRNTIRKFLTNAPRVIRLYDINLRQNTLTGEAGYSPEIIRCSCQAATVIKANQSELNAIFKILGINCPADNSVEGIKNRMEILFTRFPAEAVIITRGDQGTLVLNKNGEFVLTKPGTTNGPAYPVGAGDACSAGILFGLTLGWELHVTMELANRMGADVASHPSATPPLSDETLNFAKAQLPGNKSG
ncbi:PfkB family carbohydrate kinase [Thermodesulfobacteriota bacterium]